MYGEEVTFFSHFVRYNQGHRHGERRRGKRTQEEEVTERVGKGLDRLLTAMPEQEGKISLFYRHPCGLHWRVVNLHPPHATYLETKSDSRRTHLSGRRD